MVERPPRTSQRAEQRRRPSLRVAVRALSDGDDAERGAVFTKRSVAEAILDLSGYTASAPLADRRLLEPSFGDGSFLLPALDRLLEAFGAAGGTPAGARAALAGAIRAVEIHRETFERTRAAVAARLTRWGLAPADAEALSGAWLIRDDFLLTELDGPFQFVVGNPPYVRQERIPSELLAAYRRRYRTLYGRADLYIPFYERCLDLLADGGRLGFICANRWLKNKYGGPLRAKIAASFELLYFIDLEGTGAFRSEVLAYPAITVLSRRIGSSVTRVALRPDPSAPSMGRLSSAMLGAGPAADDRIIEVAAVPSGRDPWLLDEPGQLQLLRRLERRYPSLEEAGCRVGIGVATGADRVYIAPYDALPVEEARKLPLVTAADLEGGAVAWKRRGIVNPFLDDGSLAALEDYPLFARYLRRHRAVLSKRYVARKNPAGWYRTIDRITPSLLRRPKLLIPDISGTAAVAYDSGEYYPHHNLYVVTSGSWDLRALQAVLRSSVAVMFVSAYCVRMAGGFLRFQAQYLRRIRVPRWEDVPAALRCELAAAAEVREQRAVDGPVFRLFGLDDRACARVAAIAEGARVQPAGGGRTRGSPPRSRPPRARD